MLHSVQNSLWQGEENKHQLQAKRVSVLYQSLKDNFSEIFLQNQHQKLLENTLLRFGLSPTEAEEWGVRCYSLDQILKIFPPVGAPYTPLEWHHKDFWPTNRNSVRALTFMDNDSNVVLGELVPKLISAERPMRPSRMRHLLRGTVRDREDRLRDAWLRGFDQQIEFLKAHGVQLPCRTKTARVVKDRDLQLTITPPAAEYGIQRYRENVAQITNSMIQFLCRDLVGIVMAFLALPDRQYEGGHCPCTFCTIDEFFAEQKSNKRFV